MALPALTSLAESVVSAVEIATGILDTYFSMMKKREVLHPRHSSLEEATVKYLLHVLQFLHIPK